MIYKVLRLKSKLKLTRLIIAELNQNKFGKMSEMGEMEHQ